MPKRLVERAFLAYEVLGGLRPVPADAPRWVDFALPLWWCGLTLLALAFGAAGVKFAYIDF
jgi:hypothetical protein